MPPLSCAAQAQWRSKAVLSLLQCHNKRSHRPAPVSVSFTLTVTNWQALLAILLNQNKLGSLRNKKHFPENRIWHSPQLSTEQTIGLKAFPCQTDKMWLVNRAHSRVHWDSIGRSNMNTRFQTHKSTEVGGGRWVGALALQERHFITLVGKWELGLIQDQEFRTH